MLIEHPRIYLDAFGRTTDALLCNGGHVVAVGDRARQHHAPDERVVTPEAACLFPGLTDAHCHLWGVGRRAGSIDLSGASGPPEVLERLRGRDPELAPGDWLLGRGWDDNDWASGARLERSSLDAAFPDRPVCLYRVDNHAVAVNSEAMRRGGIALEPSDGQTDGADGRVVRDAEGRPTGMLVDAAMDPVLSAIPAPTEEEDLHLMREAAGRMRSHGIVSAHQALVSVERVETMRRLAREGELPLRLYLMVDGQDEQLDKIVEAGPFMGDDRWLSCRAVKFFADGALGSQGALMLDGYPDGSSGVSMIEPAELAARARALSAEGWQIATHAIGDLGARHVLDAYETIPEEQRNDLRPRLEHAQMLHDADLGRLSELGVIASIQPIHMRSDSAWADRVLSETQLRRLFRWGDLATHTALAAGSDYPIEDPNPWHGIATAMSRRDARGRGFHPEQALTVEGALAAYTTGAAYAAHIEGRGGQLRPGFDADVIALDRDPFESTPDEIWETEVLEVWLAGSRVSRTRSS
jgi:hypothetical protein